MSSLFTLIDLILSPSAAKNFPLRFYCEAQKLIYADNWHVILRDMFTY